MQRIIAPEMGSGEAPLLVRLGGKLVLEVLPAALASAIGAFLFAQYQFNRVPAGGQTATPTVAVPASAEMLQVVREEHAMIRDFLAAQRTAEQNRAAAADAQAAAAQGTADAMPTAAVPEPAALLPSAVKAPAPHGRTIVAAALPPIVIAGARSAPAPTAVPVMVASAQPDAAAMVAAPTGGSASAAHPSIVAETLAVPGQVMSVTLHAVMAIGGIPSWFGHRFGNDDLGTAVAASSSAS